MCSTSSELLKKTLLLGRPIPCLVCCLSRTSVTVTVSCWQLSNWPGPPTLPLLQPGRPYSPSSRCSRIAALPSQKRERERVIGSKQKGAGGEG
ncbi:unnamed protein product [Protopolystoma xenopodis]|uniref:Uncharacterized protein n=1 Tax=Protopolystoma xenopodis TaxID=117903 RepID=A0A3S5AB31_9PLAT|nr:unnamed protein product [Protopolystoma xenopodis]